MSVAKLTKTLATLTHGGYDRQEAVYFFEQLCDQSVPNRITFEGIERLCDLLDIQDVCSWQGFVMLWKLQALSEPGTISLDEFLAGMKSLDVSTCEALKKKVDHWQRPDPDASYFLRKKF